MKPVRLHYPWFSALGAMVCQEIILFSQGKKQMHPVTKAMLAHIG